MISWLLTLISLWAASGWIPGYSLILNVKAVWPFKRERTLYLTAQSNNPRRLDPSDSRSICLIWSLSNASTTPTEFCSFPHFNQANSRLRFSSSFHYLSFIHISSYNTTMRALSIQGIAKYSKITYMSVFKELCHNSGYFRWILTMEPHNHFQVTLLIYIYIYIYRGADKSLARPGRKQATATEDFEFHISYL